VYFGGAERPENARLQMFYVCFSLGIWGLRGITILNPNAVAPFEVEMTISIHTEL